MIEKSLHTRCGFAVCGELVPGSHCDFGEMGDDDGREGLRAWICWGFFCRGIVWVREWEVRYLHLLVWEDFAFGVDKDRILDGQFLLLYDIPEFDAFFISVSVV